MSLRNKQQIEKIDHGWNWQKDAWSYRWERCPLIKERNDLQKVSLLYKLQSIRIIDPNNRVDIKYELFKRIPSLKVIYHAKHDLMTRASCFSIANYVRLIGIPYSKLGKLQEIIEKYSDDEFEFGIVPMWCEGDMKRRKKTDLLS